MDQQHIELDALAVDQRLEDAAFHGSTNNPATSI
jgi:hypothetical protein